VTECDPTATPRLFQHERVAGGYATARPWLHPEVFSLARKVAGIGAAVGWALDVGCGTGLSSLALFGLARQVVGTDASIDMLRRAHRASGVRYAAATGESLPFRDGAFDLIVACGSIDWIDRARFLPRAAALLAPAAVARLRRRVVGSGQLGRSVRSVHERGLANVETHRNVGEKRHRLSCLLCGIELPLSNTSQRSLVEARDRQPHLGVGDLSFFSDQDVHEHGSAGYGVDVFSTGAASSALNA